VLGSVAGTFRRFDNDLFFTLSPSQAGHGPLPGDALVCRSSRLVLNDYRVPSPLPGEFEVFTEQSAPEDENRDIAVPLQLTTSPEPLLAYAMEDPYPPRVSRASDGNRDVFGGLSDFAGVSFSIKIGGVGFFYKGFSGR
jgi:hypothetical protein